MFWVMYYLRSLRAKDGAKVRVTAEPKRADRLQMPHVDVELEKKIQNEMGSPLGS